MGDKKQTKFIASISENNAGKSIEDFAKVLENEGVVIDHVSAMLGYLSGSTVLPIEKLKRRYKTEGLQIETDRKVSTR